MGKRSGITLSRKHGVNPSMMECPVCGKSTGIALFGRLKGDVEAPRVIKADLCEECTKNYIVAIVVENEEERKDTGIRAFLDRESVSAEFRNHNVVLMSKSDFDTIKGFNVN